MYMLGRSILMIGSSTEVKPANQNLPIGSRYYETDTGMEYQLTSTGGWVLYKPVSRPYVMDEWGVETQLAGDVMHAGSPITITVDHHEIHCGDMFNITRTVDLTNGATDAVLISVPNETVKTYHLITNILTESEAHFYLHEGASSTTIGTTLASINRNRNSTLVSSLVASFGPTVTNSGTVIHEKHWGSGRGEGSEQRGADEWILRNNTKYLLRVVNQTANNNQVSWDMNYYIHPGV